MRQEEIEEALMRPCIADNSLLANFVQAGAADLLHLLLKSPVHLSPTVLDPHEAMQSPEAWRALTPTSEFLGLLKRSLQVEEDPGGRTSTPSDLRYYQQVTPWILQFASEQGERWEPAEPDEEELALALHLSTRAVREAVRSRCANAKGRIELDAGEAEAVAIAVTRGWTILVDDQAAVNLLRCLYPDVPIIRTCELLVHAVHSGHVPCDGAATLFNEVMVETLGFYARQAGKLLKLTCDPPDCIWG